MNGERVGEWVTSRRTASLFRYDESWAGSALARPISLSLPLTADLQVRGPAVDNYFDNLLPDNPGIRARIRARFRTGSTEAFDLLTAIGRDCVGAVQLLPPGDDPVGWNRVTGVPLREEDVERLLRQVTAATPLDPDEQDEFRISIAGAQEKTALLGMAGGWFRPQHATPTTHILKLPLGIIGGFRGDLSDSVENEWLCGQFLREIGLPVAQSTMATFGSQRTLVVTRFDRRWIAVEGAAVQKKRFKPQEGMWIARLPQEDFCQATGRPTTQKYQADGGPSIADSLTLLANSETATADQTTFVLAQLAFWLLAATDGHSKNFSLFNHAGGSYRLTPLYDVLSAWPIIGNAHNQLSFKKAKLAMAIPGKNPHYRLTEVLARHWQTLAQKSGVPGLWDRIQELVEIAPGAIDRLQEHLPREFPERVYMTIRAGIHGQAQRFKHTRAHRP
jgi:serine/threonine-protein kinase HipA